MDEVYCSICSGHATFIGQLGDLLWFRCDDCGLEFYLKVED